MYSETTAEKVMKKLIAASLSFLVVVVATTFNGAAKADTLVSGKLIYPSADMPSQLVCAVSSVTRQRLCTRTRTGDRTFLLSLPAGRYFFSAEVGKIKAWMTTFNIECGFPCSRNEVRAIAVDIDGRDTLRGLCVCDWYTNEAEIVFPND
jgi:hypothetical protein